MPVDACEQDDFQVTPSAARAHAIKNCLTSIMATCNLMERQPALANHRLWKSLRAVSGRLCDLLAEQLATESVRGDQDSRTEALVALAQDAVAHHGGAMSIDGAPAEGTTITIWLPKEHRSPSQP